eukprot:scaffold19978_cov86-Skeletonema_dohrnii-CCMP3373.AAC.1
MCLCVRSGEERYLSKYIEEEIERGERRRERRERPTKARVRKKVCKYVLLTDNWRAKSDRFASKEQGFRKGGPN